MFFSDSENSGGAVQYGTSSENLQIHYYTMPNAPTEVEKILEQLTTISLIKIHFNKLSNIFFKYIQP